MHEEESDEVEWREIAIRLMRGAIAVVTEYSELLAQNDVAIEAIKIMHFELHDLLDALLKDYPLWADDCREVITLQISRLLSQDI